MPGYWTKPASFRYSEATSFGVFLSSTTREFSSRWTSFVSGVWTCSITFCASGPSDASFFESMRKLMWYGGNRCLSSLSVAYLFVVSAASVVNTNATSARTLLCARGGGGRGEHSNYFL